MQSPVVKIAQALAGTGGLRITFKVPEDAPEQCGVEFCFHLEDGDPITRLARLSPAPVGAAEEVGGSAITVHGRRLYPCEPGKVYRATVKTPERMAGRARVVGRIIASSSH